MNYFCRANCVSSKDKSITTYIVFDENTQQPLLTEELLRNNQQFREFLNDLPLIQVATITSKTLTQISTRSQPLIQVATLCLTRKREYDERKRYCK